MKELSLNILDIAENSVSAGSSLTQITLEEKDTSLTITIKDDGCGMSEEMLACVKNPFCTTRTTRKVGLGIPLLTLSAEQTGGFVEIDSKTSADFPDGHGTTVTAHYNKEHIDMTPLGDITSTVVTLIQGHPDTDFLFVHRVVGGEVRLDTRELREVLGDIPLSTPDVLAWIRENLTEQYNEISN